MKFVRNAPRPWLMLFAAALVLVVNVSPGVAQATSPKPSLSMVSVGISKYKYIGKLLSAHKDAIDMANLFRSQQGKLFGKVETKTLIDHDASAENITRALAWIKDQAAADSYTIVFLAGHGDHRVTGEFQFQAFDFHPKKQKTANIPWKLLKNTLQGLPGKAFLILDSCSAGSVNGGDNLVCLCACQPNKFRDETPKNVYYTGALLQALNGKADIDGDGTVTLAEVYDYVMRKVPYSTKGKQLPMMVRPGNGAGLLPLTQVELVARPMRPDAKS
jgi:hypothetical protein